MDLADLALGFILITIGAAGALMAIGYWTSSGVTLLSFGVFAALYGVRLLLTTPILVPVLGISPDGQALVNLGFGYWLPIPGLIFLEQLRGPGWRSSIRRLWQIWIGLAVVFTGYDLTVGVGAVASTASVFVILMVAVVLAHVVCWGPQQTERGVLTGGLVIFVLCVMYDNLVGLGVLPWAFNLERLGLGVFVLSLAVVTARQAFANQREIATMEYEMKTASAIQTSILPHEIPAVRGLDIAVRYVPMRSVAGDLYDFTAPGPEGLGILVADVTGHGVPAALIASMAKVAFTSQAACASQPGDLLGGMNRALCGHLERQFVTASYLHVDPARRLVRYSNAGHPPPLVWQPGPSQVLPLDGGGVFLGFDPTAEYTTCEMPVSRGERLLVYTDGLLEITNPAGDFFERAGLERFLREHSDLGAEPFADALLRHLGQWSGRGDVGRPFEDDLTLVVIDITD
jgi:serine phosphatase RsbU (regulator of sigma subunit)